MLYVLRRKCIAMAVFLARKVWFYLIQKQANKCTHKKGHQQRITSFKGFISQQVIRDRRLQVRCRTGRPHTSVQAESYERIVRWQKFGTVLCVPIHSTNRCVFREYILEENTKEKRKKNGFSRIRFWTISTNDRFIKLRFLQRLRAYREEMRVCTGIHWTCQISNGYARNEEQR